MDPSAFDRSFRRRLNEAVAGIKNRSFQAFTDLQNLARINPQYPGMGDILEQAEVDMGYRPPPPNPRDLARSHELTLMAQNMVYLKNRSLYPFALELLNRALELDPHNNQALALKDHVQTTMGGRETIVLDDNAEHDYQRAVMALHQGDPITALSILQRLLQNPRYRDSTKLIALQRRIESVL
jgi:tetratricopeptide (TPR) repeat protein